MKTNQTHERSGVVQGLLVATVLFAHVAWGGIHDNDACFVYHADLHLSERDLDAGDRADPDELAENLRLLNPDWVQVDSKGHPGYTSWITKVPEGRTAPHLKHDAVSAWREATKRVGIPLVCHYSGVVDVSAAMRHPEWRVVLPGMTTEPDPLGCYWKSAMCLRSGYWQQVAIPEMVELVRDYKVDGLWIDGNVWGYPGCWCARCRSEFIRRTGLADVPQKETDANWKAWMRFQLESYLEMEKACRDAVRRVNPAVKYCSNWLDTFSYPLADGCETDWSSGDLGPRWCLDQSRCEVRWLASRGRPWDMMSWMMFGAPDYRIKSVDMLCQEAAQTIAAGGVFSSCESIGGVRASQQVKWRLKRYAKVGEFLRLRAPFCRGAEGVPEIAVLNSRLSGDGLGGCPSDRLLMTETAAPRALTLALLSCRYAVDVLCERDLLRRLNSFDVVAIPENVPVSSNLVVALREYVGGGGRLLVSGTDAMKRLDEKWLGVVGWTIESKSPHGGSQWGFNTVHDGVPLKYVGTNAAPEEVFPVRSSTWGLIGRLAPTAVGIGEVFDSYECDRSGTKFPASVLNKVGKGMTLAIPADFFTATDSCGRPSESWRYLTMGMRRLLPERKVDVTASGPLDIMLRKKNDVLYVHLLNLSTGTATVPSRYEVDDIQPIGPVKVSARLSRQPKRVTLEPGGAELPVKWHHGRAVITVPSVRIHSAVAFEIRE